MSKTNPLQNFFRKSKFSITLPSRGKWYPKGSINGAEGEVEIYAMTAADDTRFKTNEILISHLATYDLIKSCIPAIKDPENMPIVDLDAAILNIRRASYGDDIELNVPVPNTSLTHKIKLSISQLTSKLPNAKEQWDEELTINDGDLSLTLKLRPLYLKNLFSTTKQIIKQQQITEQISNSNQSADQKIDEIDTQMKTLGNITVNMVIDSVQSISTNDGYSTDQISEIRQFINQIDLEYFKAIQKHLEEQKKKTSFETVSITSTPEQIAAGAPEKWTADVTFSLTNFFS